MTVLAFAVLSAVCVAGFVFAAVFCAGKSRASAECARAREALAESEAGRKSALESLERVRRESEERLAAKAEAENGLAAANQKISMMQERLAEMSGHLDGKITAEKSLAAARGEIESLSARLKERESAEMEMRRKLAAEFEAMSSKLLEDARAKMSSANLEQLSLVLKPMKMTISDFRERLESLSEMGLKGRAGLEKHIESLVKMNAQLSSDARNLAEALRGENKVAGNWGEAVFHRILEACGFKEGVHFRSQASYADSDGERKRLVPDFVIDLPGGRSIVVDSKLSLLSYSDYCSSQTPEAKRANLDKFKKSVRAHLREFSGKYNDLPDARCGFKLMFMPVEPAYELAVSSDPALLEDAYAANVLVVGPATVMSVLKYAEILVRNEAIAKNTRQIAEIGARLYERVNLFIKRLEGVGERIRMLSEDYASAKTTLMESPRSVAATARRLGAKSGVLALEADEPEESENGK